MFNIKNKEKKDSVYLLVLQILYNYKDILNCKLAKTKWKKEMKIKYLKKKLKFGFTYKKNENIKKNMLNANGINNSRTKLKLIRNEKDFWNFSP